MHKLFSKQLAEAKASGQLDLDVLARLVSATYEVADRRRRSIECAIAPVVEEVEQANRSLERVVHERTAQLESMRALLAAALDNMSQGLVMFDAEAQLMICNQRYLAMYALSPEVVGPGCALRDLLLLRIANGTLSADPDAYIANLRAALRRGEDVSLSVELGDGRTIAVLNHPMPGGGWVATHEDITARRIAEKQVAHMAGHDPLTDLANRMLLRERLAQALTSVERGGGIAVLYLDLDRFKSINDTLGHQVGDELLKAIAARLRGCVRDIDTVARIGGDEFAIVQASISDPGEAAALARRLGDVIRQPYDVNGHVVLVDTSIGIAVAPDDGTCPHDLMKNADMALYGTKAEGRGTYRFFEPEMDARMKARRALELALRAALESNQFHLHYQPILDVRRNQVSCCEALLRWTHPERGPISPAEFIPVAEEIGLIAPLGEWVLRQACADAARWPSDIRLAVNLSPIQLMNPTLLATVVNTLATSGLAPQRLELEITEAVLMQNTDSTLSTLHQLRALGVGISMDDFGTGYSSLSYLRSFPYDKIKVDRAFVSDLASGTEHVVIVQAVVSIARALGMTTTAEGVETSGQKEFLAALGCDEAQGYLFSPPVPIDQVAKIIAEWGESKTLAA